MPASYHLSRRDGSGAVLTTSRLVLRPFRPGDEADIVRHADSQPVWLSLQYTFPHPYTHADAVSWIALCQSQDPTVSFAITLAAKDAVVGGVGLRPRQDVFSHSAEVGYWLGEAQWGNGYATEALAAITTYGFEELGLLRQTAGVFSNNPASARVLEKVGYQLEGTERQAVMKEGELHDHHLYAILRSDRA